MIKKLADDYKSRQWGGSQETDIFIEIFFFNTKSFEFPVQESMEVKGLIVRALSIMHGKIDTLQ